MKIYMHEYALDTNLLFSDDGRVLGVYLDSDDLQNNIDNLTASEIKLLDDDSSPDEEELAALDFDDAA